MRDRMHRLGLITVVLFAVAGCTGKEPLPSATVEIPSEVVVTPMAVIESPAPFPVASFTLTTTPTPTLTFTSTPTATPSYTPTATLTPTLVPIKANLEWTPVIQEFDGVEMVLVPAGCFIMGSEDGHGDEQPVHEVCFEEPFWLDRTEVTRAIYQQCVNAGACTVPPASDYSTQPDQPINRVTWFQADAYCQWRDTRLPTEAEWEYAARGPDGLVYPWGNDYVGDNAVDSRNGGNQTAVVGSKPAGVSWVGALDMSGNVWEWVADWLGGYSWKPQVNPRGPAGGQYRVLRGGSFFSAASDLRAAIRNWDVPDVENVNYGFRCACSW